MPLALYLSPACSLKPDSRLDGVGDEAETTVGCATKTRKRERGGWRGRERQNWKQQQMLILMLMLMLILMLMLMLMLMQGERHGLDLPRPYVRGMSVLPSTHPSQHAAT